MLGIVQNLESDVPYITHLLSTYCMPRTATGFGDTMVNKRNPHEKKLANWSKVSSAKLIRHLINLLNHCQIYQINYLPKTYLF